MLDLLIVLNNLIQIEKKLAGNGELFFYAVKCPVKAQAGLFSLQ